MKFKVGDRVRITIDLSNDFDKLSLFIKDQNYIFKISKISGDMGDYPYNLQALDRKDEMKLDTGYAFSENYFREDNLDFACSGLAVLVNCQENKEREDSPHAV